METFDPVVSLTQGLFIELELGGEVALCRKLLLQLGDLGFVLGESLGVLCFPLGQCRLLLFQEGLKMFEVTDSLVSFSQLVVELVECGSMFSVSIGKLEFKPMNASLSRFKLFHACA